MSTWQPKPHPQHGMPIKAWKATSLTSMTHYAPDSFCAEWADFTRLMFDDGLHAQTWHNWGTPMFVEIRAGSLPDYDATVQAKGFFKTPPVFTGLNPPLGMDVQFDLVKKLTTSSNACVCNMVELLNFGCPSARGNLCRSK